MSELSEFSSLNEIVDNGRSLRQRQNNAAVAILPTDVNTTVSVVHLPQADGKHTVPSSTPVMYGEVRLTQSLEASSFTRSESKPMPPKVIGVLAIGVKQDVKAKDHIVSMISSEDKEKIRSTIDLIMWALHLYGFDSTGYRLSEQMKVWFSEASLVGCWMKYTKWRLAVFFAHWLGDQEPPSPPCKGLKNGHYLLGGRAMRFVRVLAQQPERFRSFSQTILQGIKKGAPRPSKQQLIEGAKATQKELTERRPEKILFHKDYFPAHLGEHGKLMSLEGLAGFRLTIGDRCVDRPQLEQELRRTAREILGPAARSFVFEEAVSRPSIPSTSAVYNNSRTKAGAFGDICSAVEDVPLDQRVTIRPSWHCVDSSCAYFWKASGYDPVSYMEMRSEVCDYRSGLEERFRLYYVVNNSNLRVWQEKVRRRVLEQLETGRWGPNVAEVVPLAEALKIRCITKGNSLRNYLCGFLQKFMHGTMRNHPVFRLIGRPVVAGDVAELAGNQTMKSFQLPKWFISGDYSNATNELRSWASECIADEISNLLGLSAQYRQIFFENLTRNEIKYGDVVGEQTEGQLMGSITSFPILCLANAAIIRYSYELRFGQTFLLRQLPLLVNGDDCLFIGDKNLKDIWSLVSSRLGLVESVGKTFHHKNYANINSTGFWVEDGVKLIPYVNFGLMLGLKRSDVGKGDGVEDPFELAARGIDLVDLAPEEMKGVLARAFFVRNEQKLRKFGLSYFLPQWAGGLGLPLFDGCCNLHELGLRCIRLKVAYRSMSLPVLPSSRDKSWLTRDLSKLFTAGLNSRLIHEDECDLVEGGYSALTFQSFAEFRLGCFEDNPTTDRIRQRCDVAKRLYRISGSFHFRNECYLVFENGVVPRDHVDLVRALSNPSSRLDVPLLLEDDPTQILRFALAFRY